MKMSLALLASAGLSILSAASASAQQPGNQPSNGPRLEQVARFDHQVTGVTVARDGRVFVSFPRWTEDTPVSVAELGKDGSIAPFPSDEWNAWRNARKDEMSAGDHFVCVQSVVADGEGNVWVLDPAAPAQGYVVKGGPKLVEIDLRTNKVARVIHFDEEAAPQGSYLNDVRFSPDGRHAFITDSGAQGAILVLDLQSGKARRMLDGHPSTQPEKGVVVHADGHELRRPDGRGVEFASDGIALSPDGKTLYWQAIKGHTLYSVPTQALLSTKAGEKQVEADVRKVGQNGVADGLMIGRADGRMYITSPEDDSVKVRDLKGGGDPTILLGDKRLRWPDTFAEGADGSLYLTTSHIQDSAFFKPDAPPALPTELWRIVGAQPDATGSTAPARKQ
jgi:sugar lactone lactonase YvrE